MAEEIIIPLHANKKEVYQTIMPQIKALIENESDLVANLANITAVLKEAFGFFWVGFYHVEDDELVLGPFQGPVACTRIKKGKGVCGSAWNNKKTYVVGDVEQFPGHIACSSLSKSEIVIPIFNTQHEVWGVLDIDSEEMNTFEETDRHYLEYLCGNVISNIIE